jgi:hypothetical protein
MTILSPTTSKFLVKQEIRVSHDAGLVTLHVGNSQLTLEYEGALEVSALLHAHGKEAKRNVGDTSRRWLVLGVLEDVEAREQRLQANRWA